ncbi:hypothetical protein EV363DRAFT_1300798 [Boletus edulis]|nr:hypothetical protein EV363DRAFT_1300798 [Boletus edulis]
MAALHHQWLEFGSLSGPMGSWWHGGGRDSERHVNRAKESQNPLKRRHDHIGMHVKTLLTRVVMAVSLSMHYEIGAVVGQMERLLPRDREPPQAQENSGQEGSYERSLTRLLFSLLYLPVGLVSGILRFISGLLRVPLLTSTLNFSPNYRITRQTYPDSRSATRRWITSLEEETGAVNFKTATVAATGLDGRQTTPRRHTYPPTGSADDSKILPDFFDGTYEEVLDACQKEGRIACVILVSAEHDDVAEFKRSTLTHPSFVRMLSENDFVVWGGDIRDKDSWDAAQKLQATTYPFIAFMALQPRRNHSSTSSSSTSTPVVTVLSRHYGPSIPEAGPTSAQKLVHHLEHQLLPRVNPFLTRFRSQLEEREQDRIIREQQDRAFQESAERDRERIQARFRVEQEEAERSRLENEARRQEEQKMQLEREEQANFQALRLHFRRWMRRCIVPTEHRGANGIRLALKLPGNTRVVRIFSPSATLTELYAFVDTQVLPLNLRPESDPEHILEGPGSDLQKLENHIQSHAGDAESWWGFKLLLPYPRREIKWISSVSLVETGLKSGEQLVMELTKGDTNSQHLSDDDYESDDD